MNNKEEIRELPWYVSDSEPTPQIIRKIVVKFPFYVSIRPEISCYDATFYRCRDIVKTYFTQAKSSKMQQIAEEAWKLVDQLVSLFEMGKNLDFNRWNVLNSKWGTVIRKLDMCVSSGEQQEQPAGTGQDTTSDKEEKADINIHISGGIQAENVQIGNHSSIQKQPRAEDKNEGRAKIGWLFKKITGWIFKKTSHFICAIIVAVFVTVVATVVVDILADFGWLETIKAFIYNKPCLSENHFVSR